MKTNFLKSLLAIACLLCSIGAYAHDFKVDGIYYRLLSEENQVAVTYYGDYVFDVPEEYKYTGSIVIPDSVTFQGATYSVTLIGSSAFEGCTGLTEITIPNSVTSIGAFAFYYCTGLTSVYISDISAWFGIDFGDATANPLYYAHNLYINNELVTSLVIPDDITSIGAFAFSGCTGLTEITIPNSVTSIGNSAFRGCTGLTSVTIPNSVTKIGNYAFEGCNGLTSIVVDKDNQAYDSRDNCNAIIETATNTLITGCKNSFIPNSVTSIGDYAFYYCTGLTSVTIPNSVVSIGYYAFYGCTSLTEITIPNSVVSIGIYAFYGCIGLTEITIPNSVTSIGKQAFSSCSGLTEITIPNSVTSIGDLAFSYCTGLTEITIPNSVTSIEYGAFYGCTGLTEVTIPNSVTSIGTGAFAYCTGLTEVTIPNSVTSIGWNAFAYCTGLTEITIPNSVTSIEYAAFYGCSGLRTVTIGSSVQEIGEYAFDFCDRIKTVNCYAEIPPTIYSNTFTLYVNDHATLHVPESCKALYENADYWEYFINISEDLSYSAVEDITCDNSDAPAEYYDLNGFRIENPTRGIYIVKQGDIVRKVFVNKVR